MSLQELVVNTSFLPALLCLAAAAANHWVYKYDAPRAKEIKVVTWVGLGLCYILTQIAGDWFILNQRAYFRTAVSMIMFAELWPLFYRISVPLFRDIQGRFKDAKRNTNLVE